MSAPTYQFRPGGFEDEDSDEEGFYMGSLTQEELTDKPKILVKYFLLFYQCFKNDSTYC